MKNKKKFVPFKEVPKGVGAARQPPPHSNTLNRDWKNTDFLDIMLSKFYVIYPSAEIVDWNRLMTSTLEFWKIN
jgi:hypothetical protein